MTDVQADDLDGAAPPAESRSRRQLLTLAGAAAVGGTAMALGSAGPAGAANGDPITAGETTTASLGTVLETSAAANGAFHITATADGVNGLVAATQGNAVDVKCAGTGRLSQAAATTGNAQPSHNVKDLTLGGADVPGHELVRSNTGVLWASAGGSGSATRWKRINAVRFDNPNGSGNAFAPFRLLDTRSGQSSAITRNSPLPTNQNFNMDVDGVAQIPTGAVAVFGNITVLNSDYNGFVTLFPTGVATPTVSNVNFPTGGLVGNFFQVGLSSNGSLTVRPGSAPSRSVDVIIDIFGYVQ